MAARLLYMGPCCACCAPFAQPVHATAGWAGHLFPTTAIVPHTRLLLQPDFEKTSLWLKALGAVEVLLDEGSFRVSQSGVAG